jgi:hypothetical protein
VSEGGQFLLSLDSRPDIIADAHETGMPKEILPIVKLSVSAVRQRLNPECYQEFYLSTENA